MLKMDPETKRKAKKIIADKYPKNVVLNKVKEKICKMIKKTGWKITNIVK